MVNTALLSERIKDSGKTKKYLANKVGITPVTLRSKINGLYPFNSDEMEILCNELSIRNLKEKESIFFAKG